MGLWKSIINRMWNVYSVWFVFSVYTLLIFERLHKVHPIPLVDEVFHIPQARNYCDGNFLQWDPKITTLPGLYVFSVIYLKIAGLFMGQDFCDVHGLRVFNVFLCLANFILIYKLQRQISTLGRWCDGRKCLADECKWRDLATALNMSLFPVLYYFAFFYYTEQLSTFTVLLTYSLSLTEYTKESAIMGVISIFVRQTNVIWIGFILLIKLFSLLQRDMVAVGQYVNVLKDEEFFQMVTALIYHPLYSWWKRRQAFITLISNYVVKMRHYLIVCVIFMIFVVINGGIVVGDKLAHVPVLHLSQMLYFILFASSFCMPYFIILGASFKSWLRQHYIIAAIFLVLCAVVVRYYTFVHPYLLADNRHYVFYIWKLLYERNPMIKYFLIPIYLYGGYCITYFLDTHSFAYKLSYLICVFLILVPQKLLEFRYFILPFLIFRLNVYPKYRWQLWLEFFMYAIINLSTFYLFLTREIRWDDIAEVQRLMW
ncbi:putative Dol-P-Glc:Glc(2)Man(9)GlcNAc(2)-PP-Dol alpha-1,2-glucosyltransferase [Schistocerca nitens]|uniref:putative Dol-P-Glc:Glc(2)Man(9)GlcNAc(2)-PP-Dol alpha-1,2-glucosyltransferase n=1 Tax=Schistocerca nitens TaxID=7011 RepID=UPI0021175B44|nr:putative Dol-P-Glc:Glc(2)Man(9)GlcNAc(2)-PP-Dol alpha-1,2-glucosyltransferase [Schistocerca nitens]